MVTGLKPFAPMHLKAAVDTMGAHSVSWVRRTRVNGNSWDMPEVPLGEAFEAYRVRVWHAGVLRREETVSVPRWNYEAGDRAADGVSAPFTVEIAQISDLFGPGHEARIVIDA